MDCLTSCCAQNSDGDFGYDHCRCEGNPTIDSTWKFSRLPQSHVLIEFGDDGVDDCRWKDND